VVRTCSATSVVIATIRTFAWELTSQEVIEPFSGNDAIIGRARAGFYP